VTTRSPSGLNAAVLTVLKAPANPSPRAELVALRCGVLKFVPEGLEVFVERSKTDQEQQGFVKMISYGSDPATCPVRAVKDCLELSGLVDWPVFRPINRHERIGAKALTAHAVARIVKRTALRRGCQFRSCQGIPCELAS
jgi:hypothetical protein